MELLVAVLFLLNGLILILEKQGTKKKNLKSKKSKILDNKTHRRNSLSFLEKMRLNNDFCDVEIHIDGEIFRLHRNVLAASSNVFKSMFTIDMKERNMKQITIPDIESNVFKNLVDFMYSGQIEINKENVENLWITSDYLGMINVRDAAANFLTKQLMMEIRNEKHNRSFFDILEIRYRAEIMESSHLYFTANKFIAFNLKKFMRSNEFLSMNYNQIFDLIKNDDLIVHCTKEMLFDACMNWIRHQNDERNSKMNELIAMTRFREHNPSQIYAIGGRDNNGSIEVYDVIKEEWKNGEYIPNIKYQMGVVVVKDNIFLLGGASKGSHAVAINEVDVFDKKTKMWMEKTKLITPRFDPAVAVLNDIIYVFGGRGNFDVLNSTESFEPTTNTWKLLAPMIEYRQSACAVALDGYIFVIGGIDKRSKVLNSVERFDPKRNYWEQVKPMNNEREHFGATVLHGKIYVAGGFDKNNHSLSSVEIYDPIEDNWMMAPSMNSRRGALALVSFGKIFAIGGMSSINNFFHKEEILNSVEVFDPSTKVWTFRDSMLEKRHSHSCVIVP